MLMSKQSGYFILGSKNDVCIICAKKAGKTVTQARIDNKGALENKWIHRVTSDYCECYNCLKEAINSLEEQHTELKGE